MCNASLQPYAALDSTRLAAKIILNWPTVTGRYQVTSGNAAAVSDN